MPFYLIGTIITFIIFAYVEIDEQLNGDEDYHWMIGSLAVLACAVIWPVTWIAVAHMAYIDYRDGYNAGDDGE